jgi:predicted P-loop ATPase
VTFDESVLSAIEPLRAAGFALHWLHPKTKRPIGDDWSTKPVATLDSLRRRHQAGNNLGVRLGEPSRLSDSNYLHLVDMDVRDESRSAEALAKLNELFPGIADSVPSVISGSGGSSRHYYFGCERPFTSRKLAHSDTFTHVHDARLGRDVKRWDWEIELFGTGKQAVLPPSIHPDTGGPYVWERPFDWDALAIGAGPYIPAAHLDSLGVVDNAARQLDTKPPLGLTDDEIQDILDALPLDAYCEDRDGWLQVGMALHHETGGGEDGYDLWCEFSRQSEKFNDRDQRRTWNSFKAKRNSVRMATLKAVVGQIRLEEMFEEVLPEVPAVPDIDDLIGGGTSEDEFDSIIGSATAPSLGWKSFLHVNKEGEIKSTLHNIRLMVENDERTRGLVAFNEFTQEVVQRGTPGIKPPVRQNAAKPTLQLAGPNWNLRDPVNGDFWTEDKDNAIRAVFEAPHTQGGYGIKIPDRDLRAAIDIVGRKNPFHPVREYLTKVVWDGKPRVERLFVDYLGAPDDAYHRGAARIMLTAAVTRVHEPGAKFDSAVILEGLQGKRKSTFIETLAKGWFTTLDCEFEDTKGVVETLQGAWIAEMPELSGFAKADVRHIKSFMSRRSDKVRLAYAKRAQEYHRQSIVIGSTNDDVYLKDHTGGRRFLPVKCTVQMIDTDRLHAEIDLIWAEALHIYRQMRAEQPHGMLPLYLADEEAHVAAERHQESRLVESTETALAGQIEEWLEQPINDGGFDDVGPDAQPRYRDRVCLLEIWVECLDRQEAQYIGSWPSTLGRAMRMIPGWTQTGRRERFGRYGQQRGFVRVERRNPLLPPRAGDSLIE